MSKEYGVYAKEFVSIDTNMYSYVNEEGLFSKLTSDGVTTIIESSIAEKDDEESEDSQVFFSNHVAKVNKIVKAYGAKEKIDTAEFMSYVSYQMMMTIISGADNKVTTENTGDLIRGMFKK